MSCIKEKIESSYEKLKERTGIYTKEKLSALDSEHKEVFRDLILEKLIKNHSFQEILWKFDISNIDEIFNYLEIEESLLPINRDGRTNELLDEFEKELSRVTIKVVMNYRFGVAHIMN